jgi:hypothetical protein
MWWRLVSAAVLEAVTFVRVRGILCRNLNMEFRDHPFYELGWIRG